MADAFITITNLVPNQVSVRMVGDPNTERFTQFQAEDDRLTVFFEPLADGQPHTYEITVRESSGRSETRSVTQTVGTLCRPVTNALLTGSTTPDPDKLLTYSVASDGSPTFSYKWSIYGGTIVGRDDAAVVSVRWTQSGAGSLTVLITNPCGQVEKKFPIVVMLGTPCQLAIVQIDRVVTPAGQSGSTYQLSLAPGAVAGPYRYSVRSGTGVAVQSGPTRAEADGRVLINLPASIPAGSYTAELETVTDPVCSAVGTLFTHSLDGYPCNQACTGATYTPEQITNWPLSLILLRRKGNDLSVPFVSEAALIDWLRLPGYPATIQAGYTLSTDLLPATEKIPVRRSRIVQASGSVYSPLPCGYVATGITVEDGQVRQCVLLTLDNCGTVLDAQIRTISTPPLVNHPPVGAALVDQSGVVDQDFRYEAPASSDSDGDTLSYVWDGLPAGLTGSGRVMSGKPTQVGVFAVALTTSDPAGLTDTRTMTLTITLAPLPPCILTEQEIIGQYVHDGVSDALQTRQLGTGIWTLVTQPVSGVTQDRYYPRGKNFQNRSDVVRNKSVPANCLAGEDTGLGGRVKPDGITLPTGYVQGIDLAGEVYFEKAPAPPTLPAAPSALTAKALSTVVISLGWTDNASNEAAFEVERAIGSGAFTKLATLATNVTVYEDTTAAPATQYCYRVRSANTAGASAYTATVCATTPSAPVVNDPFGETWKGGENRKDWEQTPFTMDQAPVLDGTQNTETN